MARTAGSSGARTAEAIRAAGVRLIHAHGYEAVSLRQLAAEVGLQPGSLYRYFDTKQSLLFDIVRDHMEALLAHLSDALAGVDGPAARLDAFVRFHVDYHLTRSALVFIAQSEIRSLEPANRVAIVALRHRYEAVLEDILEAGAATGAFRVADVPVAAFAILALLTGISAWYRPDGRLDPAALAAIHLDLVRGAVLAHRAA